MAHWEFDSPGSYRVKTSTGEMVDLLLLIFCLSAASDTTQYRIIEVYSRSQLMDVLADTDTYQVHDEVREMLLSFEIPMQNSEYPLKIVDGLAAIIYADGLERLAEDEDDEEESDEELISSVARPLKVTASS